MTWLPLPPLAAPTSIIARQAAVTLAGNLANGKTRAAMSLVVRAFMLEGGAGFCAAGTAFTVLAGAGEHAGMLRLCTLSPFDYRWGKPGGKMSTGIVMVRLPWPKGVVAQKQRGTALEFDHGDGWLEVMLPAWARPEPAVTPIADATLEAANKARVSAGMDRLQASLPKPPYVSQASRVPDPAAQDRVRQREGRA